MSIARIRAALARPWRRLKRLLAPPERRHFRHVTDDPEDAARVVNEMRDEGWRLERTTREGER